jgi:hypothetical protein
MGPNTELVEDLFQNDATCCTDETVLHRIQIKHQIIRMVRC